LWKPKPDFETAVTAWILAGGAHHTVFSQSVTTECLEDYAEIAGVEYVVIDEKTTITDFKNELRWNDVYFQQPR
jgi:L-arabinose isomerase